MSAPTSDLRSSSSPEPTPTPERAPLPSWKSEARSRVSAHRARAGRIPENQPALPGMEDDLTPASIAARVAERYARIPSYREMLARRAAADAAAAETAAAEARNPAPPLPEPPIRLEKDAPSDTPQPVQQELLRYSVSSDSLPAAPVTPVQARVPAHSIHRPSLDLSDPFEEALVEPSSPLPARLIENPRELVAPRKARPRLAEGPLREEQRAAAETEDPALREDEVMPRRTSPLPLLSSRDQPDNEPRRAPVRSQWLSIQLDTDAPAREDRRASSPSPAAAPLHVASLQDRSIAALVDIGLVASAFLLFIGVFAVSTTHFPTGKVALAGAAAILLAMGLLYQYVFFTLTDATPGMRYARIALCTFDDENPTRPAMRARIVALLLSALPLGLGFLWAVFDEDSLGWHDRITRTYQRSYRNLQSQGL